MQLLHGYTNFTSLNEGLVEKTYIGKDNLERQKREFLALTELKDFLPVPVVAEKEIQTGVIRTFYVPGEHGQDLIDKDYPELVLFLCGQLLRRVQEVEIKLFKGKIPGDGEVLVHGDFGPQNTLFNLEKGAVAALLDWEWVHLGNSLEDLAWAEWIIRMHHPTQTKSLAALFQGYGKKPPWDLRHREMLQKCHYFLDRANNLQDQQGVSQWQDRLDRTSQFEELTG